MFCAKLRTSVSLLIDLDVKRQTVSPGPKEANKQKLNNSPKHCSLVYQVSRQYLLGVIRILFLFHKVHRDVEVSTAGRSQGNVSGYSTAGGLTDATE